MSARELTQGQASRAELLAKVATFTAPATSGMRRVSDAPVEPIAVPGPLRSADRELLERLLNQLGQYGAQLTRVCMAVEFREIDGFTPAELHAIGNACGTLASKIMTRLDQDTGARMIGKRNTQLKRAA